MARSKKAGSAAHRPSCCAGRPGWDGVKDRCVPFGGNRVSILWRILGGVSLGVVLFCLPASTASASDYAIGSDAKSITVDQAVHPGQSVTLPSFGIYNNGTKPANYQMTVVSVGAKDRLDPSWVTLEPKEFSLEPGGKSTITATISVPADARPGTYRALLAGRLVSKGHASVTMSVGIGPMVTIQVASGWWLSAAWFRTEGFFRGHAPWSYLGTGVAVLAFFAGVLGLVDRRLRRRRTGRGLTIQTDLAGAEAGEIGGSDEIKA